MDSKDNVIVGTEPGGLILRISPAGEGFVLHQAARREVTTVAVNAARCDLCRGDREQIRCTFTDAFDPHSPFPTPTIRPAAPVQGPGPARHGADQPHLSAQLPSALPPLVVRRIGGLPDRHRQLSAAHLAPIRRTSSTPSASIRQGRPIVGDGEQGQHLSHRFRSGKHTPDQRVAHPGHGLRGWPKGRLYAATGNVGKVYQVGPELQEDRHLRKRTPGRPVLLVSGPCAL